MNRHAKASSAASTKRQASGLGRIARAAFAGGGVSSGAAGSSALSSRGRPAILALSALALAGFVLAVTVSSTFASKQVIDYFGGASESGSKGGEFNSPRDIAVNTTGAGGVPSGTIYVADDSNNRVQRFSSSGGFVSAWGASVLTPSADEVQALTVSATAGTFKLTFEGASTADLSFNADATAVQNALRGLPTIGAPGNSNVEVSGSGPFTIRFYPFGNLAATDVGQIGVDNSSLTGTASVTTEMQGSGQFEICTVAADCQRGAATGGPNVGTNVKNGSLDDPQSVAVDEDTGNVYVSDRDNRRINEYSATGTFIRTFGWGVDASTPGNEYEVCPAADRCTFGIGGSGAGQIGAGSTEGALGIAVSPADGNASSGTLFVADTANRRVNTYNLDGTSPSSFGSEAQFEEREPRKVAVDSRGIVYASNSKSAGEIERYDTENANGGGVGFLAPITMPPLLEGFAEQATAGLAVDPDSDGAGPEEDALYVLRGSWASGGVVQQFGPTNDPGLTAPPTAVDDMHGGEAGFGTFSVLGLGLDDSSGRLFVSSTFGGGESAHRVYILDDVTAPAAALDPITSFNAHSATFTGAVNPNGDQTRYRFEYVDDATFLATGFANASRTPVNDVNLGSGTSPIDVEAETPHRLVPSTTYHVRLVAKQIFTSTETIGGPLTFTTPAAAPSFAAGATAGEEEATLRASINPEGQAVSSYHFEWGTSESYGNATPAGTLPAGGEPVAVSAVLGGLTSGQTYHYRLLATNATGTTTGTDQTFTTTTPPQFPKRAFELVSQYPTGGIPASPDNVSLSENGNRVSFLSQPFPTSNLLPPQDQLGGEGTPHYGSVRGADGWHVEEFGLAERADGSGMSADGTKYLFSTSTGGPEESRFDPDDANNTSGTFFASSDVYQRQPDGSLQWISRDPRIPVGTPQTDTGDAGLSGRLGMAQMSVDGKTVVFNSARQLLGADTTPDGFGGEHRLYKWENGQLSFIGIRPDGSVPSQGEALGDRIQGALQGTVSRDGSRVLFGANRDDSFSSSRTLYIQTDGQPTAEAVKETGVPPLPADQPFNVQYRGAAADLSRAFFTSNSRLTPDSGASATAPDFSGQGDADLYVYDVNADEVRDLTPRLDGIDDPSVDPAAVDRGRTLGLVANSEDGKRVYFVADAQYPTAPNPEGELPSSDGRNLYLAELDGIDEPIKLRFIGALAPGDEAVWQPGLNDGDGKRAYASPDGRVLGFGSSEPLTGQALGGTTQLFVYDAEADALKCASCPSGGALPIGDVNVRPGLLPGEDGHMWQTTHNYKRWVSTDGRVFFHTATQLVPADTNGVEDVYEYLDGQPHLISSGTGSRASRLQNVSRDGNTVIFYTSDALVPYDEEPGLPKLYAARVGGGFALPPKPVACDLGAGACEGAGTHAANQPGAGSAAFEGPGNPKAKKPGRSCPKGKRKVRRHGKVRCAPAKGRKHHHERHAKDNRRASR